MRIYNDICSKIEQLTFELQLKKMLYKDDPKPIELYNIRLLLKEIEYLENKLMRIEKAFVFRQRRKSIK